MPTPRRRPPGLRLLGPRHPRARRRLRSHRGAGCLRPRRRGRRLREDEGGGHPTGPRRRRRGAVDGRRHALGHRRPGRPRRRLPHRPGPRHRRRFPDVLRRRRLRLRRRPRRRRRLHRGGRTGPPGGVVHPHGAANGHGGDRAGVPVGRRQANADERAAHVVRARRRSPGRGLVPDAAEAAAVHVLRAAHSALARGVPHRPGAGGPGVEPEGPRRFAPRRRPRTDGRLVGGVLPGPVPATRAAGPAGFARAGRASRSDQAARTSDPNPPRPAARGAASSGRGDRRPWSRPRCRCCR